MVYKLFAFFFNLYLIIGGSNTKTVLTVLLESINDSLIVLLEILKNIFQDTNQYHIMLAYHIAQFIDGVKYSRISRLASDSSNISFQYLLAP